MFLLNRKIFQTFVLNEYITTKKLINVVKGFYYYHYSGNPKIGSRPLRIVVDPGNICALKCPLCPTGLGSSARKKQFLSFEDFKIIIDQAKEYLYEVDLYNWGEPFLNKDIFRMIRYAKEARIKVNISSSLNALGQGYAKKIVDAGIDDLTVSLDGVSQETYTQYRIGGQFNEVVSNIKEIIKLRELKKLKKPRIIWQFLIMKHNQDYMAQAKTMARQMRVDRIIFRPMRCDMGKEILLTDQEKIATAKAWLPTKEQYSRYSYKRQIKKNRPTKCLFLETTMVINADGSASPCCGVYDSRWDFGNVFKEGVLGVWNNAKYQQARRAVRDRDDSDQDLICSYCIKNGFLEY